MWWRLFKKDRISPEYWLHTAGKGLTELKFWKKVHRFEKGSCHCDVFSGKWEVRGQTFQDMSADLQITAFEKAGESSSKGQYIILGRAAPPQKISELRKKH